jgi:2',3'-cyclic-nucleotide 2'-phosphodiesterase (5'-nucleotidase family)
MSKVVGLEKSLKDKSKKEAKDLRFGNLKDTFSSTAKEKEQFLKDNPNVKTQAEMMKKIKDKKSARLTESRMNRGGKSSYPAFKKGGSVKKKKSSRKALRGGGCEIR